jgi:hypothetical protein
VKVEFPSFSSPPWWIAFPVSNHGGSVVAALAAVPHSIGQPEVRLVPTPLPDLAEFHLKADELIEPNSTQDLPGAADAHTIRPELENWHTTAADTPSRRGCIRKDGKELIRRRGSAGGRVVLGIAALAVTAPLIRSWSDLMRYLRVRRM